MPTLTPSVSRILSVDDDPDACEMLSLLLKTMQIDVTCVQSAAEAWPKINAERFDLYVLDAWLPNVDGYALCRQIRSCDPSTPILFYSGAAYDADKEKGIAAGANAYVTKPNVEGLISSTMDLLAKSKLEAFARSWMSTQSLAPQDWCEGLSFNVRTAAA